MATFYTDDQKRVRKVERRNRRYYTAMASNYAAPISRLPPIGSLPALGKAPPPTPAGWDALANTEPTGIPSDQMEGVGAALAPGDEGLIHGHGPGGQGPPGLTGTNPGRGRGPPQPPDLIHLGPTNKPQSENANTLLAAIRTQEMRMNEAGARGNVNPMLNRAMREYELNYGELPETQQNEQRPDTAITSTAVPYTLLPHGRLQLI